MVIHGWTIYFHACFEEQLNALLTEVQEKVERRPGDYRTSNAFKRLAAVSTLAFDRIPRNPADPGYRQGGTLGKDHKHWFRAKFFQQYRLFFRYSEVERVIVYAWVNDDETLRAYESRNDAYATFARMLADGRPPDDWKALKKAVIEDGQLETVVNRITRLQADRQA